MLVAILVSSSFAKGAVKIEEWGKTPAGETVKLYTLSDASVRVRLTEYGARIVSVDAPDRRGQTSDVVLGYNDLEQYVSDPKDYFGATIGRVGNRIAKGSFSLSGTEYHVPLNNNGNALHGGTVGFSNKVWRGSAEGHNKVEFTLISPDGDMGFPGILTVHVRYTLMSALLRIDYEAKTTKSTVVNLTNHTYFNLAGEASGNILGQRLHIAADRITPIDATLIPTGSLDAVANTPFDFRKLTAIGDRIDEDSEQLQRAGGYDHNYVLNGEPGMLRKAAFVIDPASGRTLTVLTSEPGLQFYSGNFLSGTSKGYSGTAYQKHAGFCLETQHFPDSPNHANFPSTVLKPGATLRSTTELVFGIDAAGKR